MRFFIDEIFKEKCAESNLVKRALRAIEEWNNFDWHVYEMKEW